MSIQRLCVGMAFALVACAPGQKDRSADGVRTSAQGNAQAVATNTPEAGKAPVVLFIGTSLTAGYGLDPDQAYPAVLERMAREAGLPITAVNAGVSGETSSGARGRMDWLLRQPADVIVLETGANDALRALPVSVPRRNIGKMLDQMKEAKPGVPILLVQMEAPRNLGADYYEPFHDLYGDLARAKQVTLVPFLLDSVAGISRLNLSDGLHPNAEGAKVVASNVWRSLAPVIQSLRSQR